MFRPTTHGQEWPRNVGFPLRYLQLATVLLLVVLPQLLKGNQWMRFALIVCGLFIAALLLETWTLAHYAAPVMGLVFVVMLQAARCLRLWRWHGRPLGRIVVSGILVVYATSFVVAASRLSWIDDEEWRRQISHRAPILACLKQAGGRHLVLVRYGPDKSPHVEWVYNEADIDGAKVVWAREMDVAQNRRLLEYFKDRQVWLLKVNAETPKLVPYSSSPVPD